MEEKLQYFIDRTDERLHRIESKIEELIGFKIMLLGLAAFLGAAAGLIVELFKQ